MILNLFGILINLFFLFYVSMRQLELCKKFRLSHFKLNLIWFIISISSVAYFLYNFIDKFNETNPMPAIFGFGISFISFFIIVLSILLELEDLIVFRYRILKDPFWYKAHFQTLKYGLFPLWKPVEKEWIENYFYDKHSLFSLFDTPNIEIEKHFKTEQEAKEAIETYKNHTHKKYIKWFFETPEKDKIEITYY